MAREELEASQAPLSSALSSLGSLGSLLPPAAAAAAAAVAVAVGQTSASRLDRLDSVYERLHKRLPGRYQVPPGEGAAERKGEGKRDLGQQAPPHTPQVVIEASKAMKKAEDKHVLRQKGSRDRALLIDQQAFAFQMLAEDEALLPRSSSNSTSQSLRTLTSEHLASPSRSASPSLRHRRLQLSKQPVAGLRRDLSAVHQESEESQPKARQQPVHEVYLDLKSYLSSM